MTHWVIFYAGVNAISALALAGWLLSLLRNNVNVVGSFWALSVGMSAYCYALFFYELHARVYLVLILITLWATRLAGYLAWRDWLRNEDFRYAIEREKNRKFFWLTSLITIFGAQTLLAWLVSSPLFAAIENNAPLNFFDLLGATLVIGGILIETIADAQLVNFKQQPSNQHRVLANGLWHFCRHPNYLGECCVWWGFVCFAFGVGAWWTIISPLLIMVLVFTHGIAKIEKNCLRHRPDYASYITSTPIFFRNFQNNVRPSAKNGQIELARPSTLR